MDLNGRVRSIVGKDGFCNIRFQGQVYDDDIQLCYNRFRWYDDLDGRYISKDPIGLESQEANFYSYVGDSNTWIDVFGLAGYNSKKHGKVFASVTILSRRKIKNYQVEVHVDSHGPHIHIDRGGGKKEQYINITNMNLNDALSHLPNKLKKDSSVQSAVQKAIDY
ncbi:RHS repeat domain-containing protein [Tenacibaculum maritimum]|uniref:RHS repeat domain-containing protein n=1 Tax=Tenacibaculum maritimum TaxID=107401 RepID=UPI00132F75A4|nr:RHS repeat-associated core domain-containing protein [Tenacibaculum maritimum]